MEEAAQKVLTELSEPQAKTIREYISALKFGDPSVEAELLARRAFDNHVKNKYGFPPAKYSFEHFRAARLLEDETWESYCELCGEAAVKVKDENGRTVRLDYVCKPNCPGVVLGYWEQENTEY